MITRNRYNRRRCYSECNQMGRRCQMPEKMPVDPQYANAYVPYQSIMETFSPMDSLANGTTFPELVSPYEQNQSQCMIQYLSQTETCVEEGSRCYE